ncbi:hypothetical protein ABT294_13820 [Nonomuraea sp. NPDC000554]|uniref:hypothetical protein n=1 Tax=Nonomuraea sp. NPDC000554 TaxID=3154259 RepID=UPI0033309811
MVIDPELPPEDARLLRENGDLLARVAQGWAPAPPPLSRRDRAAGIMMAGTALAAVCGLLALVEVNRLVLLLVGFLGVVALTLYFVSREPFEDPAVARERRLHGRVRSLEGRYVLPDQLDDDARALLERTRAAVRAVTTSRVNGDGLLDGARNAVMLPAEQWEIARRLAKLSALRVKHHETVAGGVTPEVAAVVEPLTAALETGEHAVVARVEALEKYAADVAEAERAYRARDQVEELRGRLHQYEEVVAEAGADALAVPEIAGLAEDAGRLERALRDSVSSAHEAFRHLGR